MYIYIKTLVYLISLCLYINYLANMKCLNIRSITNIFLNLLFTYTYHILFIIMVIYIIDCTSMINYRQFYF